MRKQLFALVPALTFALLGTSPALAVLITFDWNTEPEASNFDGTTAAATTVDGVTLTAAMLNPSRDSFNISTGPQALGAQGIGSNQQFDGEDGFTFSFDTAGTLTSITLEGEFTPGYDLITPNDGTHSYTTDFTGETFTFSAGQFFTWDHGFGAYRIGSFVIDVQPQSSPVVVPEPSCLLLFALPLLAFIRRRRAR